MKKRLSKKELILLRDTIISAGNIPRHVAIIMDGNGRWAKERGLPRVAGHSGGVDSVREVVEGCGELGVQVLTLYAFSQENWTRPAWEVSALMKLLMRTIHNELENLNKQNVKLTTIGHIEHLPADTHQQLLRAVESTKNNTGFHLNLALSYSSRVEILDAVRSILADVQKKIVSTDDISDSVFNRYLYTRDLPDPDLLIRTSGEYRISNFLLWQIAYAELYITSTFWPDFRKQNLYEAIMNYQTRERRFGKVSEQLEQNKKKTGSGKTK
jgi:undecaprenyl diphosphate synthase